MKPKLLLRIAAILIFVHTVLHTIGFSGWKNAPDPVEKGVIAEMTGHKFPFMGAVHSLADYYDGFGYCCSVALLLIAVVLWLVSNDLSSNSNLAKKIVLAISYALLLWGIDEYIFFFPFAACITFAACICSRWSVYLMKKSAESFV